MKYIPIGIFAIAMGLLEAVVVCYLRYLLYPEGFSFPLAPIPPDIYLPEILRETSTLVMLAVIGYISGRTFTERFAWFIYTFGIWDIFYYVFLKVFINWPDSLLTWDILFLIPVVWTSPVIVPLIVSLSMIFLACLVISFTERGVKVIIKPHEWVGLIAGGLILMIGFIWDYSAFIFRYFTFREIFIVPDKTALFSTAVKYFPERFNWWLFVTGQSLIFIVTGVLYMRLRKVWKMTGVPLSG